MKKTTGMAALAGIWGAALVTLATLGLVTDSSRGQDPPTYRQQRDHPQTSTFDVVEARKFVLRDDSGLVRMEIGPTAKGNAIGLRFLDRKGKDRLVLAVADDGEDVDLALADPDGTARVVLSVQPDGQMVLVSGDRQAGVYALKGKETGFIVDDADDTRAMLGVDAAGKPLLVP